jgi:hypothetical protein
MLKKIIKLPEGVNPDGLLTVKKAALLTGLPATTIYNFRKVPGNGGVRFYKHKHGGRLFLKAAEFVQWINLHFKEV